MIYLLLTLISCFYLYALTYKPEIIAVLFFTITISDINVEIPGFFLNFRALVGLTLFARSLIPDKNNKIPSLFSTSARNIVLFLIYITIVTMSYDLVDAAFIKATGLTLISVYCGYVYYYKTRDYRYLKISIILSGLICFSDMVYTYAAVGTFPVQRIYLLLLKVPVEVDAKGNFLEVINHGFYGFVCGITFVLLINEFINRRITNKISLVLLPLMFLGLLMSTSRSSLLGIIGISIFLIGHQLRSNENSTKTIKIITLGVTSVIISLFLFISIKDTLNLNSAFIDNITGRMVDEPVAVFQKHLGLNYNAQSLDALEWREEASSNAYEAYMGLKPVEQVFGIGFWGFVVRNLGRNNLPPHNGFLMILIEYGLVGLVLYLSILISVFRKSFKTQQAISALATSLIFIILYCIGQNAELTTSTTFFICHYSNS